MRQGGYRKAVHKNMEQIFTVNGKRLFSDNSAFCVCIALYYALYVLNRVLSSLLPGAVALSMFIRLGTYGSIIFILLGLIISSRRILVLIGLEAIMGALFILSIITGNIGNTDWKSVYELIATTYIPLALAAYYVTDRKMLMACLYPVAVVSVPVLIAVAVLSYGNWDSSYDMTLGYVMVFSVLVLLAQFTVDSKAYNLIFAGILSIFILFVGSRGPFICIVAFGVIELILSERYSAKRKFEIILLLSIAVGILWVNINTILMYVYELSVDLGFDSRSILLLMQGEAISHDSGRNVLQDHYMNLISREPIFGYGVMGEWISDGMYPHNIILEFILAFGYPIGILILVALLCVMVSAVRKEGDKYSNALIILFISYSIHLFVSSTYLKVWQFFVCIALCLPRNEIAADGEFAWRSRYNTVNETGKR